MNPLQSVLLAASVTLTAATQAATHSAAPLQVSAIDHVGINVPDIDTATRFFSALMGARVISDISPGKIPDQWKSQFRWHGSSELQRFVMLQMDGGAKLELFQYQGSEVNQVQPHGDDAGASHVALRTADIDGSLATLKRLNVTILNEPITNTDGVRWFYFQAPWGTQIELVLLPQSVGG
ncbi:Catechol 2,3-dioxygenase [Pseudomonas sp. NFACC15-1]|uniref:VOC family protein n=1 Tax=unclassified Pseudomonas TaxID=196821 RepID=UPI000887C5BE|nr:MULTISPECIES: VOC family protein [unclassified Pseudomonas]SDA92465.1 Catechol 2,3-dioxygenase [Pseudomonas sp. NFACC15-1]SDZ05958.1 Catechol 2,3-dioxygenase [Pseudomonas sp. NFACC14]